MSEAVLAATKEALSGLWTGDHRKWLRQLGAMKIAIPGAQAGLESIKDMFDTFEDKYHSPEGLMYEGLRLGDSNDCNVALRGLAALHYALVPEIARVAKVNSAGISRLFARPAYAAGAARDSQGQRARRVIGEFFSEAMNESLESLGLVRLLEGTDYWESWEHVKEAGEFFPTVAVEAKIMKEVLDEATELGIASSIAVSKSMQACFHLLPPAGRVLYAAFTKLWAGGDSTVAAVAHRSNHPAAAGVRNLIRTYLRGQDTAPLESDVYRWVGRAATLVQLDLTVYKAVVQLHGELSKTPNWEIAEVPTFEFQRAPIDMALEVRMQEISGQHGWLYGDTFPKGTNSLTPELKGVSTVSASDGMRFLESQMRNKSSNYKMPGAGSAQQDWVNWFTTVEGFVRMFPTPHQIVVENLTTGVADDDVRIYGWKARCEQLALDHISWRVADFLTHVRGQVLSTVTTRKAAWEELQALERTYVDLTDCIALGTRLRKLYQQIYDTTSTEVEPVSRLQCIRQIHTFLTMLHTRGKWSAPICKAWRPFTRYDATDIFIRYIHQDKHSASSTESLCLEYLTEVCEQLTIAHDMYTQLDCKQAHNSSNGRHDRQINSFTYNKERGGRSFSSGRGAGSSSKRSRSSGSGASPRPTRGRTDSRPDSRPGRGAAPSGRGGRGGRAVPTRDTTGTAPNFAEVVEKLCKDKPDYAPPYVRQLAGIRPAMSAEECMTAIRHGKCIICQESHPYKQCNLRNRDHPQKKEADEFIRVYFECKRELDGDAAK